MGFSPLLGILSCVNKTHNNPSLHFTHVHSFSAQMAQCCCNYPHFTGGSDAPALAVTAQSGWFCPGQFPALPWNKEGPGSSIPAPNPGIKGAEGWGGPFSWKSDRMRGEGLSLGQGRFTLDIRDKKPPRKAWKALERSLKDLSAFS